MNPFSASIHGPATPDQSATSTSIIDLRSDTVTKPTFAMRQAMAEAEVGDDVYGEDPTIHRLEKRAAEIFGREAAIFVPTGTMGNQIAIKIHTRPGQEIICETRAHIFNWEMATLSSFSGCIVRPVQTRDGVLTWSDIEPQIAPNIYYRAETGLVVIENTHNMAGGTITPRSVMDEIANRAHQAGLPVHVDGARIFNAAAALNTSVRELTASADSVMFCLSKGLAAPVGSMLVGSRAFINAARIYRKALGGGMRQAGILAAAGLIAIEEMPKRLTEDHENAQFLAKELAIIPGIVLDVSTVQTNIVIFELLAAKTEEPSHSEAAELTRRLADRGVLASAIGPRHVRLVTHMDIRRADCQQAIETIRELLAE